MVDGFPYKEEVGGSSPSVPTIIKISDFKSQISNVQKAESLGREHPRTQQQRMAGFEILKI